MQALFTAYILGEISVAEVSVLEACCDGREFKSHIADSKFS